jgi:hypothetical protein
MPLQILTLKLDGITAGDYLMWCRDPDPPALDFALRSISIDADRHDQRDPRLEPVSGSGPGRRHRRGTTTLHGHRDPRAAD